MAPSVYFLLRVHCLVSYLLACPHSCINQTLQRGKLVDGNHTPHVTAQCLREGAPVPGSPQPTVLLTGGALAHAFLPRRGEAHFDQDERWSLSRRRGRNLFVVLAHEIGHTLGLPHSPAPRALMAPYYKKLGRDALLSWDDVLAVQNLYGEPLVLYWLYPSPLGSSILDFPSHFLSQTLPCPKVPKAPLKSKHLRGFAFPPALH